MQHEITVRVLTKEVASVLAPYQLPSFVGVD